MGSVNNVSEKKTVHSSNDNATQRVPEAEQKGFWSVRLSVPDFVSVCPDYIPVQPLHLG